MIDGKKIDVPVVILAGGLGTRLREETDVRPKPMVEVGGRPMLWHLMKHYAAFGVKEFVICLGYKGEVIKEFFLNYRQYQGSLSVEMSSGAYRMHEAHSEDPWTVHLLDTGVDTMTGGRIKRAAAFLGRKRFFATYGDGVANIDIRDLLTLHEQEGRAATITAVRPPARFGGLVIDGSSITQFAEKPTVGEGWINGGFMVFEPSIVELIEGDKTVLERAPLERLASSGQLTAFQHHGFWQCMDTVRDLTYLRELWDSGSPPWKTW
jgi:glucose-1-phosphate cytidylyltransferase